MKTNEKEPLLVVRNLKKHFDLSTLGNKKILAAVDGIDFEIYKGETFGLVGESGCGKTTTGRLIVKLYQTTDGDIIFDGNNYAGKPEKELRAFRKRVQMIFQDPYASLNARMTVFEIIAEGIKTHKLLETKEEVRKRVFEFLDQIGLSSINVDYDKIADGIKKYNMLIGSRIANEKHIDSLLVDAGLKENEISYQLLKKELINNRFFDTRKAIQERVHTLLEKVGLKREHASRYPHEFSGGQRQRIGIARALALNPELIVCDEPISALDVSIQAQVINMLEDLQEEFGLTYLFIAHDLSMVRHISDRIGVMYLGKMMEIGVSDDVYERPLHPYTKSLLSAIPVANPREKMSDKRVILQGDVSSPINPKPGCRFASRCPYAEPICHSETPEFREVMPNRYAACHLIETINDLTTKKVLK